MNTKKKVFEALSKRVKKVDLSLIQDLDQAVGMHTLDDMNFNEIKSLETNALDFSNAMDQLAFVMGPFIRAYEFVESNYNFDTLANSITVVEDAMTRFREASIELGVDYANNESYQIGEEGLEDLVKAQQMSDELLSTFEDTYRIAKSLKNI